MSTPFTAADLARLAREHDRIQLRVEPGTSLVTILVDDKVYASGIDVFELRDENKEFPARGLKFAPSPPLAGMDGVSPT